ncbi:MAG: hypothetical protein Q7T87_01710 [Polaromonas sp.]|nr:hypothetical protein [Polaromonas sp.]
MTVDLQRQYAQARQQLELLQSAPDKDMPAIDELIHQLEKLQLALKIQQGIQGNNPNE